MAIGTPKETVTEDFRGLLSTIPIRGADTLGSTAPHRNLACPAAHCHTCRSCRHWLEGLQALRRKMVGKAKEWAMSKHLIENMCWKTVSIQRPFKQETIWEILTHLAAMSPRGAVVWEARDCKGKAAYFIGADKQYISKIEAVFHAHCQVQFGEADAKSRCPVAAARHLKTTNTRLSLNTAITDAVIRAGLAALVGNKSGTETVLQVVLGRGFSPSSVPQDLSDPSADWLNIILGSVPKVTAEARKGVKEKADQHGFQAAIRIGVSDAKAVSQLRSLVSALKVLESAGVRIREEPENPSHLNTAHVPWHFPLQRVSVKEIANFLLLPAGEEELPGSAGLHPKVLLTPSWYRPPTAKSQDRTFGVSLDAIQPKRLSLTPQDSLEHLHIIGPTGSGKSTAMMSLILADIKAGRSILVIDPKADLIIEILARIPEERADDVVVLDPSSPCPCGFNPLAFRHYKNRTLIADAILSVLAEVFRDSWGVRISDILSAALLTLAEVEGSTLLWILPLLTNDGFRRKIVAQIKDQVGLMPFWQEYEALSPAMRQTWIAPVSNKLRTFSTRPGLRNMLGQAHPKFDLSGLFTERKIVLVPLNKGQIGNEAARMIGSLVIGLTWVLALSRARVPPERRSIVSIYIDELQDYLSLPTDLNDALAQARGLHVAMTLAHQFRDQLPPEIRAGVDANCRNKIVFNLSSKDAKDTAAMAPELSAEDFMTLPRYSVYASFQAGGRNIGWVSGKTLPPPPALRDPAELYAQSMATYGVPAEEVEAEYLKLFTNPKAPGDNSGDAPIGRRKR